MQQGQEVKAVDLKSRMTTVWKEGHSNRVDNLAGNGGQDAYVHQNWLPRCRLCSRSSSSCSTHHSRKHHHEILSLSPWPGAFGRAHERVGGEHA